jgi:hypothetical protein
MIARATAAMAPIRIILRGPIIKYGASCLIELIKTFLERDAMFALFMLLGLLLQRSTVPAIPGNFEFSLLKDVQLSLEYFPCVRGCLVFLFPIGLNVAAILPTGNLKNKNCCCWSITRRESDIHTLLE